MTNGKTASLAATETRGRSSREIVSNFLDLLSFSQTFGADNRAIRVGSEIALIKPAFEQHNYGDEKAPSLTMNFAKTLMAKRIAILPLLAFLTACSYGPERLHVSLENVIAKPSSHTFAAAVEVSRVRDPVGFISRFPNGGIRDVLAVEARVYLIHVDKASIERVAVFEDYGGIPNPKSASVSGWRDDTLYVTLFGYGGHNSSWNGDQLDDPRYVYYEVPPSGTVQKIESLPENRTRARQTGPLQTPPFLRLGKGHLDVRIGIDDRPGQPNHGAIFSVDPETGQPSLTFLDSPPTTP